MKYELTTIVADESVANPAPSVLDAAGAKLVREEEVGRRKFSYPINKLTSGVYTRFTIDTDPASIAGIDDALRRDSSVLRHLIVTQQYEPVAATPAAVVDEAAIEALGDVGEMTKAAEVAAKAKKEEPSEVTEPADAAPIEEPADETTSESVTKPTEDQLMGDEDMTITADKGNDGSEVDKAQRQVDLDKKLDEILGKNK